MLRVKFYCLKQVAKEEGINIPGAYGTLHRTSVDWAFQTEPQPHVNNRKMFIPRGKVLGGCSSTNAMAYVRGNVKIIMSGLLWAIKAGVIKKYYRTLKSQNIMSGSASLIIVTKDC